MQRKDLFANESENSDANKKGKVAKVTMKRVSVKGY